MAATSMMRAGKVSDESAREIVTSPSSSGWRRPSRAETRNSGNSSRNRTPRCARLTSPGRGVAPPPTRPTAEMVWCGARNGRRTTSATPGGSTPATLCTRVTSIDSSTDSGGMIEGTRRASMVLPAPGGPTMSRLCAPATATSRTRLTRPWPSTSERSVSVARRGPAARRRRGRQAAAAGAPASSAAASRSVAAGSTRRPVTRAASPALAAGTSSARRPRRRALCATASTPATGRTAPSRPSSPMAAAPSRAQRLWPVAQSSARAIGRSNDGPSLRTSAGARLTVMRREGNS